MTDKNSNQISASTGVFCRMGAQTEQDGITFSVAVPSEETVSLILYRRGTEEIVKEIPFQKQSYSGVVYTMKVKGISPEQYEYNYRIGKKVVTDPAARLVVGRPVFGDRTPRGEHQVRGGFLTEKFDWKTDRDALQLPYEDVIAYHLHVRGFTRQKNSKVRHKGTFQGLQEKIPYLKELGINQVILMPSYEFDEIMQETAAGARGVPMTRTSEELPGKLNYWGYMKGFYYAPKFSYSVSGKPDVEFKSLVRTLHENGIELLMEFAFPDPVDTEMVNDCLSWWVQEYHVDGFSLLMNQTAAAGLAGNPILMKTKLITGYFPTDTIYPEGRETSYRNLAECNEGFKVDARKLLKGDEDQLERFAGRVRYNPEDKAVINYITSHDGFTMMDLVSYDKKHNEENGEQGRDGAACDYSWNCGLEGPTKKRGIVKLRMQQMRNAFAMLLLSQGTPMLLAGDEFGNSQQGNNNPYCHDSELAWVDWSREKANHELTDFVRELIAFRKEHKILHMEKALTGGDMRSCGYPDFSCHGSRAWYGDFEYQNRHMGLMYCGIYAEKEEFIYVAYNFHWEAQTLALPQLPEGMEWSVALDTCDADGKAVKQDAEQDENPVAKQDAEQDANLAAGQNVKRDAADSGACLSRMVLGKAFEIPGRSIQVLVGAKPTEKAAVEKAATEKDIKCHRML